ncbi:MAG: flagellar protein FliS [Deltaproteobacteria bacterium]|nr:flagellar protein FliS [Deltaproteobacteria bacterium]
MNARALSCYRSVYVESAPPADVLDQLLTKALSCLDEAAVFAEAKNVRDKAARVDRVLAIVGELSAALDHSVAPELTGNLERLYDFAAARVLESSATGEGKGFGEAARILKSVRDSFREARGVRGRG